MSIFLVLKYPPKTFPQFKSVEVRLATLFAHKCKCREGGCFKQYSVKEVQSFLDMFQARSKREQDAILFMSLQDGSRRRKEYFFLNQPIKRACYEALLGVSSHRLDKAGAFDRRYKDAKDPAKPSEITASVDSFCMVSYNSIAEPLPDKSFDCLSNCIVHMLSSLLS